MFLKFKRKSEENGPVIINLNCIISVALDDRDEGISFFECGSPHNGRYTIKKKDKVWISYDIFGGWDTIKYKDLKSWLIDNY